MTTQLTKASEVRLALKELEDLINEWRRGLALVPHAEVEKKRELEDQLRASGFTIAERWDDESDRAVLGLEWRRIGVGEGASHA